jgi:hypothetical protein
MTVNLEGVKQAEKIVVDVVDSMEFKLEVDGLYRWRTYSCQDCCDSNDSRPQGWHGHALAAHRSARLLTCLLCDSLKMMLPCKVKDEEKVIANIASCESSSHAVSDAMAPLVGDRTEWSVYIRKRIRNSRSVPLPSRLPPSCALSLLSMLDARCACR